MEPEFIWGNSKQVVTREISMGDHFAKCYREFKKRGAVGGGIYLTIFPAYIPVDLEITKAILQKDFNHFVNRGLFFNEEVDPLQGHLVNLENEKWRYLRTKLTPTFTSGRYYVRFIL